MDLRTALRRAIAAAIRTSHTVLARSTAAVSRVVGRVDVWGQDHHVALLVVLLTVVAPTLAVSAWLHFDAVVEAARRLAPVLTVVSLVVGAVVSAVRWVRSRRSARIRAAGQGTTDSDRRGPATG
ncbi:hypothetical protein [Streptomyces sp. NPDC096351]|uniref:hypothetical protein n=1 Tax=Streptomyces sp. NPDC096351 TaxID=3366087 RepID=UPI0037FD6868